MTPCTQLPTLSLSCTRSAWTAVAGIGSCLMRMAEWRDLSFFRKIPPAAPVIDPPPASQCWPGHPAGEKRLLSEKKQAPDKRRRAAKTKRTHTHSQHGPLQPLATVGVSTATLTAISPSPARHAGDAGASAAGIVPALPPVESPSPPPDPLLWRWAKISSEASHNSCWVASIAEQCAIPQFDGLISPSSSFSSTTSSPITPSANQLPVPAPCPNIAYLAASCPTLAYRITNASSPPSKILLLPTPCGVPICRELVYVRFVTWTHFSTANKSAHHVLKTDIECYYAHTNRERGEHLSKVPVRTCTSSGSMLYLLIKPNEHKY